MRTKTQYLKPALWLCLVAMVTFLLAQPGWSHGGQALSKETLKKLFPQADAFVTRPLSLSAQQRQRIESRLGGKLEGHDLKSKAYIASRGGRSLGVVWATDAHLKKGAVDVIVGVAMDGKVTGVVLDHSKVPGLNAAAYLDQYKKLTTSSAFQEGKDLKSLAGQEPSSKQVAAAVKKGAVIISESFLSKP